MRVDKPETTGYFVIVVGWKNQTLKHTHTQVRTDGRTSHTCIYVYIYIANPPSTHTIYVYLCSCVQVGNCVTHTQTAHTPHTTARIHVFIIIIITIIIILGVQMKSISHTEDTCEVAQLCVLAIHLCVCVFFFFFHRPTRGFIVYIRFYIASHDDF